MLTFPGEMSDASEVLYTLYEAVNGVAGAQSPVDAVFGLRVKEGVCCASCNATTHQQARSIVLHLLRMFVACLAFTYCDELLDP